MNESAITNAYLRDLSSHCTQVRKDMRGAIRSVKGSVEKYNEAESNIKKACANKMKEILMLNPYECEKLPEIQIAKKRITTGLKNMRVGKILKASSGV